MNSTLESTHGVVRFSLKESIRSLEKNPKKESLILMHFSSKNRRFKKSIGYKCPLLHWDVKKQKVKTGKGMMQNAYKINKRIDDIRVFTEKELSNMVSDVGTIDLEKLSQLVSSKIKSKDNEEDTIKSYVVNYAKNLIESKRNRINVTTFRSYNQTIKLLELYEKSYSDKLKFDHINLTFYRSFVDLLEDEEYSLNSIGKHIKNLKIFLNDALVNGITSNTIFKHRAFKVLKEVTTEIYLTEDEIRILAKKDFENRPEIELARDIFLIGCYTGQRVSDYNGLTDSNIDVIDGHKFIKIHQKKTGTIVHVPITKEIQGIMNRYNGSFPRKLSEPILRKNIKTACSAAGFKEDIEISYVKGGKLVKETIPKYKMVKTHTARRSFCTNYYIAGKPIQNIMLFSGHKTEREFLKYIRIVKKQEALAVLKSGFFE
ncbi:MAG: site-specific integrase [Aureisphaera sp.]